ncbi:MAG: FKBP-type peptidyl-prolyl cis-trans isomerase [Terracidiphilus sp.]
MNRFVLFLSFAAFTVAASAQTTPAKPATAAKPVSSTAKPAPAAAPASAPESQPWIKLPPGVPRVVHLPVKMPFALRYEDIKVGTGAVGETGKLWHLKYTGWRAADGIKFDSWDMHTQPVIGPDGKPKLGPDGKPVMGELKPIEIPQGIGRVIPGFDYGIDGMKIGGKRRIFIPWQMAYGTRAIPDRPERPGSPASPGIPAKSDLIFDVELLDVTDMPMPPQRPMMPPNRPMPMQPHPGAGAQPNAAPTPKPAPPATQTAPSTSTPAQPAAPAQPTQPPTSTQTPAQPQQK